MWFTPYNTVYGKQVGLRIEFEIKTLRTTLQVEMDLSEAQHQLNQLNELNEIHKDAFQETIIVQQQRERWHDKFIRKK